MSAAAHCIVKMFDNAGFDFSIETWFIVLLSYCFLKVAVQHWIITPVPK